MSLITRRSCLPQNPDSSLDKGHAAGLPFQVDEVSAWPASQKLNRVSFTSAGPTPVSRKVRPSVISMMTTGASWHAPSHPATSTGDIRPFLATAA